MSYPYALVIDESAPIRKLVSNTLKFDAQIGHVISAETPVQALDMMASRAGDLLCVVSDIDTKDMPVPEFIQQLNKTQTEPTTPIFLLTDDMGKRLSSDMLHLNPTAVLKKPFKPHQLMGLIDAYVGENDRRRAKRIMPIDSCDVNFESGGRQQFYSAEVINISDNGILLECPLGIQRHCGVYDIVRLTLHVISGMSISLGGDVVRMEAYRHGSEKFGYAVKVAINFCTMEERFRDALNKYILLHNDEEERGSH